MSVLIKGIKVHRGRCYECPCFDGEYGDCNVLEKDVHYVSYEECPIIELPDHGDLIDRSMLIGGFADWYIQESPMYLGDSKVVAETIGDAMKAIEAAPVIIPAERSEASLCDNCDEQSDAGCSWCKRMERSEDERE